MDAFLALGKWLNDNDGAVIAALTFVLVCATIFYAWQTSRQAQASAEAVEQMKKQAEAAAQMVQEIRTDRDLAWEPHVVLLGNNLKNIGQGPALNCRMAYYSFVRPDERWVTHLLTLGPGEDRPRSEERTAPAHLVETILGDLLDQARDQGRGEFRAWVCADRLRRKYRFQEGGAPPEVWRPGEPEPPWTKWLE